MGGARRGVGIAQPVQIRLNPNLLSGAISPGRTSITPWAWPVGCADSANEQQYRLFTGHIRNPRQSRPVCRQETMPVQLRRAAIKLKQEGRKIMKHCLISMALGASASLALWSGVMMDAWNVALYWTIVAAYWVLRLLEERHDD